MSGTRNDSTIDLEDGEYQLLSLKEPYPEYKHHRKYEKLDWKSLKRAYNNRCATCGSEEGKPHFQWPESTTKLQKAHMDPTKPLELGNIIPQCQKCNRGDRNRWFYDNKGRVIGIANPSVIDNCSIEIKKQIYLKLKKEFKGE